MGRVLVVVLAVGQIVSTIAFEVWSPTELGPGAQFSPLVSPAPMFAIWGVIIAASILWALLQVRPSVLTGGSWWYAAAACYALVGAAISATTSGSPVLAIALGVGVVLLLGSTLTVRSSRRR